MEDVFLQSAPAPSPQGAKPYDPVRSGNPASATSSTYPNGNPHFPLNAAASRNTDSCLPLDTGTPVTHNYSVPNGAPAPGSLAFRWMYGSPIAALDRDPRIQVIAYNDDTYLLRQNVCVHWEAPFTYLLFGNRGAVLIDTGATADPEHYPLRTVVDGLIDAWASTRGRKSVPLTIVLTSAEDVAQNQGLAQFANRPQTTTFAGQASQIDLGDRMLQVLPTKGTHRDGVSVYDPYTHLLFTGDLLYPGKIQIANDRDYIASLERLVSFRDTHPVKWIMGGHIEMQFLPGKAYPRFYTYKPYERVLEMLPALLDDALASARSIAGQQVVLVRPDFWLLNRVSPDQKTSVFPAGIPNIAAPRPF